ncbi:MAG: diaminopimelate epimerase [Puniceicoccaceae bacterium]|nr:MAG: diaminopimelate epimerase [Puniceicoccaceae bacterium]
MRIPFTKMHGAGNDFVVIDNRGGDFPHDPALVARLCHRRFGIGADGLLLLEIPPHAGPEARMVYFNADGSRAEMCGNGARCFTAFALARGLGGDGRLHFLTDAGALTASSGPAGIRVVMTEPANLRTGLSLDLGDGPVELHSVNTGVPHAVLFVGDLEAVDLPRLGAEIRHHPAFAPAGTNVNFAAVQSGGLVRIRTYERGVEAETLACGTGVTAVGILASLLHDLPPPVRVRVAGGDTLAVDFKTEAGNPVEVTMTGPAHTVFTGEIDL